jgi:hypothetical protein
MKMRTQQMAAFAETSNNSFESRMIVHLRKCFPGKCGGQSEDRLLDFIQQGKKRAAGYGITTERDICKFIDVRTVHGPDFDQTPWASKILNDGLYKTSTARVERLFDEALQQPAQD